MNGARILVRHAGHVLTFDDVALLWGHLRSLGSFTAMDVINYTYAKRRHLGDAVVGLTDNLIRQMKRDGVIRWNAEGRCWRVMR